MIEYYGLYNIILEKFLYSDMDESGHGHELFWGDDIYLFQHITSLEFNETIDVELIELAHGSVNWIEFKDCYWVKIDVTGDPKTRLYIHGVDHRNRYLVDVSYYE